MSRDAHVPPVVVDVQALQNPLHRDRGIGRYVRGHVDGLLDAGAPIAALVLNPDQPAPTADAVPRRWFESGLVRWNEPALARELASRRFIYHVTSPFEPAVPEDGVVVRHMLEAADAVVVMLHDVIPLLFPEWYQRTDEQRSFFRRRAELVRAADAVVTNSEHTRRDAIEHLGIDAARVHHIGTGPSARTGTTVPLPASIDRPFVLTVTGWGEPRKNPSSTFAAFAALPRAVRAAHQLVVVCELPDEGRAAWRAALDDLGLAAGEVVLTGRVDDAVLDALYTDAALFVFTSRYEGFGMPALEAAVAGAPVLTSDVSSLPEVIDDDLALVPLDDVEELARRMTDALTVPATQRALRTASERAAGRHTWAAVAGRTLEVYRAVTASSRTPARSAPALTDRLRLALVGPYPPSKSGIATWSERLVRALDVHADVEVFREGDPVLPPRRAAMPHAPHRRRFPVEAFGRAIGGCEYDVPIYTIGNGYHHRHTLAAALHTPGVVWLHEARLAGLYLTCAGLFHPGVEPTPAEIESARHTMAQAVRRMHGPAAEALGDDDWWRTEAYDERGYSFLADIVGAALTIIVSTETAAQEVRTIGTNVPVHVLPLPFPERAATATSAVDDDDDDDGPWLVSFGWVDPIKQPDVLIRSFAAVRRRGHDVRLAFVGELAPTTRAQLDAVAQELGAADGITYTGFVTPEQYDQWLARTTVAVQLRATSRGEASAALHDAVAAGRPTITNIPTAGELPDDAVVHVDGTDPDALADSLAGAIDRLLTDAGERARLTQGALAHAARWRFDDLAARVHDIARSARRTPVPAHR